MERRRYLAGAVTCPKRTKVSRDLIKARKWKRGLKDKPIFKKSTTLSQQREWKWHCSNRTLQARISTPVALGRSLDRIWNRIGNISGSLPQPIHRRSSRLHWHATVRPCLLHCEPALWQLHIGHIWGRLS